MKRQENAVQGNGHIDLDFIPIFEAKKKNYEEKFRRKS